MSEVLELKNVDAGYGELAVLKGVSIAIGGKGHNEIVALIGPNGAGKSTVIKAIFGLADVTAGRIMLHGNDITNLESHELIKNGIAYVNQGRVVFGNLTVRENLEIGTYTGSKSDIGYVYNIFPVLKEKEKQLASTLSGGQRQMLAIARALMQNPGLLLMDEPSLGLSPKLQSGLFLTISSLKRKGLSILIVEQNAKKAIQIADRTYLLEDGKIVLEGGKDILKHKKIKNVYLGGRY